MQVRIDNNQTCRTTSCCGSFHAYFAQDSLSNTAYMRGPFESKGHHCLMLFELHRSLVLLRNRAREFRREVSQSRPAGFTGRRNHGSQSKDKAQS
jgi:hypothetical protein